MESAVLLTDTDDLIGAVRARKITTFYEAETGEASVLLKMPRNRSNLECSSRLEVEVPTTLTCPRVESNRGCGGKHHW